MISLMTTFENLKEMSSKIDEIHAQMVRKQKISQAPHQIVKYKLGAIMLVLGNTTKSLQECTADEIKAAITSYQLEKGPMIFKNYDVTEEINKRHLWTYLGRPTIFAFTLADFLWPRNFFSIHHLASLNPLTPSKIRMRKDKSEKEYVLQDELTFYKDLALYCGASLIQPEFLPHWLEEGRAALVRRGTEFYRGKRKLDANALENSAFTPLFSRPQLHTDGDQNDIFTHEDNSDHDNGLTQFLEDDEQESDHGDGAQQNIDSDESDEFEF